MLDRKFILQNVEMIKENCQKRFRNVDIDAFVYWENRRRELLDSVEKLRHEANNQEEIARHTEGMRDKVRALKQDISNATKELDIAEKHAFELLQDIPNMTHPDVPCGETDADSTEIFHSEIAVEQKPFPVKEHIDIGIELDILDLDSARKISGSGFYFLKDDGVRLERALQELVLQKLTAAGFTLYTVPEMVKEKYITSTGYSPRGEETNIYKVADQDLNLIATSEIPLCAMHADKIFEHHDFPLLSCGISHCYRTERSAGQATRGIYRVHQFSKVEMVVLCLPEESEIWHQKLLEIEKSIFDSLEIPYRVVDIASGDLGNPAYRKYDIEGWIPTRFKHGAYGELTSASNCTDFQSRRLKIRYRPENSTKTEYIHTLNGTGIAITRAIIAILENHQQPDGSVRLPKSVADLMGKERLVPVRGK